MAQSGKDMLVKWIIPASDSTTVCGERAIWALLVKLWILRLQAFSYWQPFTMAQVLGMQVVSEFDMGYIALDGNGEYHHGATSCLSCIFFRRRASRRKIGGSI